MRSILLGTVFALFSTLAIAGPDCSNISKDSRMVGCNGIPDFSVAAPLADTSRPDNSRENTAIPDGSKKDEPSDDDEPSEV